MAGRYGLVFGEVFVVSRWFQLHADGKALGERLQAFRY